MVFKMETTGSNNMCQKCFKPFFNDGQTTTKTDLCKCNQLLEQKQIVGWICPRCHGGVSPYSTSCPCVPKYTFTLSSY